MANLRFEQFQYTLEKGVVTLFAKIAIGGTGAPTLDVAKSKGILSVARNSAGKYTVTLTDKYQYTMGAQNTIVLAAGVPATASNVQMVVRADNALAATPTVVVEFLGNAGTPLELTSGAVLMLEIKLKNSLV